MERMGFVSQKTFHDTLVDWIYDFLMKDARKNKICIFYINNTSSRTKKSWVKLQLETGETIYPDIVDNTNKIVYEIHVKGERRREYFDKLPKNWKGINVFFDEENNPETLVAKLESGNIERIKWNEITRKGE